MDIKHCSWCNSEVTPCEDDNFYVCDCGNIGYLTDKNPGFKTLKNLLSSIYCNNCRHDSYDDLLDEDGEAYNSPCDECHRKNMYWQPSDEFISKILKTLKQPAGS